MTSGSSSVGCGCGSIACFSGGISKLAAWVRAIVFLNGTHSSIFEFVWGLVAWLVAWLFVEAQGCSGPWFAISVAIKRDQSEFLSHYVFLCPNACRFDYLLVFRLLFLFRPLF